MVRPSCIGCRGRALSCEKVADGAELFPGRTAHLAPGHTPGCLVFHWRTPDRNVIFTGDAAKSRAEPISRDTDMPNDAANSRSSIEMIWRLWRQRLGTMVVPGHNLPMVPDNGAPHYLGKRKAGVKAWFRDDMASLTTFDLSMATGR